LTIDLDSSEKALYPQDSAGTISGGYLSLKFSWSDDTWVFAKEKTEDGLVTVKAALQIFDSFIESVDSKAGTYRFNAEQNLDSARYNTRQAEQYDDYDQRYGDNIARNYRRDAASDKREAKENTSSADNLKALANRERTTRQAWASFVQ
jgi:hypothetical protein